jgi:hypothetical protein
VVAALPVAVSWRRSRRLYGRLNLADGVGFEPTVGSHPRRFSRPVP